MKRVIFCCVNVLMLFTLVCSAQNAGEKAEKPATHPSRDKVEFRKALIADRSKPLENIPPTTTPPREVNLMKFWDGTCNERFISTLGLDKSKQTLIQKAISDSWAICDDKLFAPAKSEVLSQKNDIYLPGVPVADFESVTKQLEATFLTFLPADVTARLMVKWQSEGRDYFCREVLVVYVTDPSFADIEGGIVIHEPFIMMVSHGGQWPTVSFHSKSQSNDPVWNKFTIKNDGSRTVDDDFVPQIELNF